MRKITNPFVNGINIPDEYFCGREQETTDIIRHITNGTNLVIKAPRRIGKSSLIKHVLGRPEIAKSFNAVYVDVLGTTTASEFVTEFRNAFMGAKFTLSARLKKNLMERLNSGVEIDPSQAFPGVCGLPKLSLLYAPRTIEFSLKEIFDFLEGTSKRNIVVFDEFQQIENYSEKITAKLRSFTQEANNTSFIFSGSSRHLLNTMFESANEPFYRSAIPMDLDIIPIDTYREYCSGMFSNAGITIENDAVEMAYCLFCGNTKDIQEIMRNAFSFAEKGDVISGEAIRSIILNLTISRDQQYRELLDKLNKKKERNLLFCIANEGLVTNLSGRETMKRYDLDNASAVQNALQNLTGDKYNLVYRIGHNHYRVIDKYFELWLALRSGDIDRKFNGCRKMFEQERRILTESASLKLPAVKEL